MNSINPESNLWQVINHESTVEHFGRMIEIGTKDFHESAFAVYKKVGQMAVSTLLIPEINATDALDTNATYQHNSLDISSLICKSDEDYDVTDLLIDDEASFSEIAQKTLHGIRTSTDLGAEDKFNLVNAVRTKEIQRLNNIPMTPTFRDDLYLTVHNHPQLTFSKLALHRLLMPSTPDVKVFERVRQLNPLAIDGIVSSDGKNHGLVLYRAADPTIPTKPNYYTVTYKGKDYRQQVQSNLRTAGYMSTFVDLKSNGQPKKDQQTKVDEFCGSELISA